MNWSPIFPTLFQGSIHNVINSYFSFIKLQTALFLGILGAMASDIYANPTDPVEFCKNPCRSSGPCDQGATKEECTLICKEGIWESVATDEMNDKSEAFRVEKDSQKRSGMLLQSSIAKCLGKTEIEQPPSPFPPAEMNAEDKHDLCAAAKKAQEAHIEETLMAHKIGAAS